jgi:hypothetical protein
VTNVFCQTTEGTTTQRKRRKRETGKAKVVVPNQDLI